MRFVQIIIASLVLSSCVSLETIDRCTVNPFKTLYCLTVEPVVNAAEYADEAVGGGNEKGNPPSASNAKVPKINKPESSWGKD